MITKEQAERLQSARQTIDDVQAEMRESTGDDRLVVWSVSTYRGPHIGVYDAGLVPADVEAVRGCGYGDGVRWQWEVEGVLFTRRLELNDYLNEIGMGDAIPRKANRC